MAVERRYTASILALRTITGMLGSRLIDSWRINGFLVYIFASRTNDLLHFKGSFGIDGLSELDIHSSTPAPTLALCDILDLRASDFYSPHTSLHQLCCK